MKSHSERCPACGRKNKRTGQANAYYWMLLQEIAERVQQGRYSKESYHHYFKTKFIGSDHIDLPTGQVVVIPKSSAAMDTAEFQDYVTKIEAWAAERGIYLDSLEAA